MLAQRGIVLHFEHYLRLAFAPRDPEQTDPEVHWLGRDTDDEDCDLPPRLLDAGRPLVHLLSAQFKALVVGGREGLLLGDDQLPGCRLVGYRKEFVATRCDSAVAKLQASLRACEKL